MSFGVLNAVFQRADAAETRTLSCENELIPHSQTLIEKTRAKASSDPDYARQLRETDANLVRAWEATERAIKNTRQKLIELVEGWNKEKARANTMQNGHTIVMSETGKIYDVDDKVAVSVDADQYDWSGKPTWEDYLLVKAEYDTLSSELDELFKYRCETLIPSRNRVVPFEKLNL